MSDKRLLALVAGLTDVEHRRSRARELARYIGADDLIVFVRDAELDLLLPAAGFPQTLPSGRKWRDFVAACVDQGESIAELPYMDADDVTPAFGFSVTDGAVMALLGGVPQPDRVASVRLLLPLLAAAFTGEHAVRVADGHAAVANQAAERASSLALSLDSARRDLRSALNREQSARQDLAFLADASAVLSSSLDYATMLKDLGQIVVPYVADCCAMVITSGDEAQPPIHVEVAGSSSSQRRVLEDLTREYVIARRSSDCPMVRALRSGLPEILSGHSMERMRRAIDEQHQVWVETLRPVSLMVTPLQARNRTLGVMTFISSASERRYRERDLALARQLAQRVAMAVDNALLYRAAQDAIRDRENFLSVAAHELKTPITSLRAFAQLIRQRLKRDGTISPDKMHQTVDLFERQTEKLTALIEQLLDFSRIEAGHLDLQKRATDLVVLSNEVAAIARTRTDQHAIRVVAPSSVVAEVDALRLEQVLTNLVENAIRYSPDGGEITLRVWMSAAGEASISVSDHGIGIAWEDQKHIFERFYQTTGADKYGGMGLGLYISHEIIRLHSGQIRVESVPEEGTQFTITLPTAVLNIAPTEADQMEQTAGQ